MIAADREARLDSITDVPLAGICGRNDHHNNDPRRIWSVVESPFRPLKSSVN
jgi:hypothetical protein